MPRKRNPIDQQRLEVEFVDKTTLHETTRALADIAAGKAQHILDNWQDRRTANTWAKAARLLDRAADTIQKLEI